MTPPLIINFDYGPTSPKFDGITHLMKIYQGVPYDQTIDVKNSAGVSKDFSGYTSMKLQAKLTQMDTTYLLELSSSNGHLIGTSSGLQIVFPGSVTKSLELPLKDTAEVSQVKFVYDINLYTGLDVVERLSQGIGYIVASTGS